MSYRLRASNFAASFIKIGEWQRASRNEGDLVAKFYFVKKKLVWEFLQGPMKYKIEIPWSDIIGINAVMEKNQPGILRIELNQPPTFHEEINPQPRRHTMWKLVKDFTGMQASIFRLHHLTFPCEYLDKHYQKLLLCEPRFFDLSKQSFPTLKNPFFHSNSHGNPGFAFDYNQGGQDSNLRSQFNFPNFPSHVHPAATFQNYSLANLGQEAVMNNNALLGDIQAGNYHEKYHMEMIESLSKMVNLHKEVNPESKIASQETYEQQKFTRMPQIHPANPPTPQQRNNFPYDPVNYLNPTVDEFGNINNFKNIWS
ncbi:Homeobox protein [Salix suchowensis]|nr:Homeobox protein [Salix suchowensis]